MTNYLHYSNSSNSLDDIGNAICQTTMDDEARKILHLSNSHIQQPSAKRANCSPIILPGANGNRISLPQCTPQEHQRLNALSHQVGGAATLALSELVEELNISSFAGDLNTFGGNGIGVKSKLMVGDISKYDKVLKEYHDLKNHRAAPATLMRKAAELKVAFAKMNDSLDRRGQHILHKHATKTKEVLNATGRVVRESIPLSNNVDVQRLAKLAKAGRVVGPGFILLDGYLRYDKVSAMYQQNNTNWKREAVVQSSGFFMGIGAGIGVAFIIGFAPVGIVVGIVAAGALAVIADKAFTGIASEAYDLIIR